MRVSGYGYEMEILSRMPVLQPAKKKSRLSYSITFKLAAVRHAELHGNRSTARYLGINEKQIRDWRSKKVCLMNTNSNAKRLKGAGRQVTDTRRERDLKEWIEQEQRDGKPVSRTEVQEKAKVLSSSTDFKASAGWLRRWKLRHNVSLEQSSTLDSFNNNFTMTPFGTVIPSSDGLSFLQPIKVEYQKDIKMEFQKDREVRDRITCALALLELNSSTTIHPYKGVY